MNDGERYALELSEDQFITMCDLLYMIWEDSMAPAVCVNDARNLLIEVNRQFPEMEYDLRPYWERHRFTPPASP